MENKPNEPAINNNEPGNTDHAANTEPTPKTFTQDDVNRLVGEARVKARNQASGELEDLKKQLDDANKAKADAEAKAASLEADAERARWRKQAAQEAGVPESIVKGGTLEEMQAHAKEIAAAFGDKQLYGKVPESNNKGDNAMSKADILAIKDRKKRRAAIEEHIELFE